MATNIKYPVITISREYAAYGRTIAAALSEKLGIPVYDRDFVKETAKASGYSEEDIQNESETMSRMSRFLNDLLNNAIVYNSSYDGIFKAQKEIILKLAQEPCIIVGRCADAILSEAGVDSFNVFLYADMEHRVKRAREMQENADVKDENLAKVIGKKDSLRKTYYKEYTGKELGDYKNYNIALDTGTLGIETCVDILVKAIAE